MRRIALLLCVHCLFFATSEARALTDRLKNIHDLQIISPFGTNHFRTYCRIEGMLGFHGDPELKGPVERVSIVQYRAQPDERGSLEKGSVEKRVEITFARSGQTSMFRHDHRGDGTHVSGTAYEPDDEHSYTVWPVWGAEGFRYAQVRDEARRPLRLELWSGEELIRVEEAYTWDENERSLTVLNSLGQLNTMRFDERGNVVRHAMSTHENPEKELLVYTATYRDDDQPVTYEFCDLTIDRCSHLRWEYDASGRPVRQHRDLTMQGERSQIGRTEWTWDHQGNIVRFFNEYNQDVQENVYRRDPRGHITAIERCIVDEGSARSETLRFRNDAHGNWIWASRESGDGCTILEREIAYYQEQAKLDE